jgi:hypothetical protein
MDLVSRLIDNQSLALRDKTLWICYSILHAGAGVYFLRQPFWNNGISRVQHLLFWAHPDSGACSVDDTEADIDRSTMRAATCSPSIIPT